MDKTYWEQIAPHHEEQIFDVWKNDSRKIISSRIQQYASPRKVAIDIGCSVGKWLPLLSSSFKKVFAADISSNFIREAKLRHSGLSNIEYLRTDISATKKNLPVCDVAVCINAVMMPSFKKRHSFFTAVSRIVRQGGHLILAVPSLESALYSRFMLDYWDFKDGKRVTSQATEKQTNALQGIVALDGVPTKHYLKEEITQTLTFQKFQVLDVSKVEYTWESEFNHPPGWMNAPYPWDWVVVAKKVA